VPQIGTPEQYFGSPPQEVVTSQPIQATVEARMVEPVEVKYAQAQTDQTPLIIAICFLGAVSIGLVVVLGLHIWLSKKRS